MDCRDSDPDFLARLAKINQEQQRRGNGLNKLELAGRAILKRMGLEFEEQALLFGKFTVDVYLRDHGLIVQWDGDYWHGNPRMFMVLNAIQSKNMGVDKRCDAYLRKCGLRVLRFWESDVKWRPEMVTTEITKALAGVNIG
jgi:very-short-patch-repair endonuclease